MEPKNPYRTAPGSIPPALAGRDAELGAARYAIETAAAGSAAKPIVFTGLRGMGKTALLRRCSAECRAATGFVILAEADRTQPFADAMRRELQAGLDASRPIPRRLNSAIGRIIEYLPKLSYELPHEAGSIAISGSDDDPPERNDSIEDALLTLNEQLARHNRFLLIAIDEIQESVPAELLRVIRVVHATAGSERPILLFGAGLPASPDVLKAARSYTERYAYLHLGLLDRTATCAAIETPATELGVTWEPAATDLVYELTLGYPYFIQEYASAAWLTHRGNIIRRTDVTTIAPGIQRLLDESLYDRIFANVTPREIAYVLALHALGPGPHHNAEISHQIGESSSALGSTRSQLIKKDVLYARARGMTEFRLPLTENYIERNLAALQRRAAARS